MSSTLHDRFTFPEDPGEIERLLEARVRSAAPSNGAKNGSRTHGASAHVDEAARFVDPNQTKRAASSTRHANGQFAKGNGGGPGNPFNRQLAALRKLFLQSVTPEAFKQAYDILMARINGGDLAALKLFFQYTLGKPHEPVDPDRVALHEYDLLHERKLKAKEWGQLLGTPSLDLLLEATEFLGEASTQMFTEKFLDALEAPEREAAIRAERAAKRKARAEQSGETVQKANGKVAAAATPV